jgi:hypothetical protein
MQKWAGQIITIGILFTAVRGIALAPAVQGATTLRTPSVEFHEGQVFPTMVLPTLDGGRPGSVADFRGKKLILHIFASW